MISIHDARVQAILNYLGEFYPDFDQYLGSAVMFAERLATRIDEAEVVWFEKRCEADRETAE